ncbi:Mkk1p [Rhizophagus irregularis DAOM 197198w]|uniref:Mkk1p n=1 Tax=Rhizophagus irregularis (strain DAOM 197198w) TaxID=1432141 RepID=A0A015K7T0_RHIIW|nr:Mkk1p [Rhizophagus irregularis DAOM 197198w]
MTSIREDIVFDAINRAFALTDFNTQDTIDKQFEFMQQTILADKSLTKDEKSYAAVKLLNKDFDYYKILENEGIKRICENCHDECLATLYCEHCVRNYLKSKFSNWTSGNNDIDNLIQQCQMETLQPDSIVEWIPYDKLQNIEYLTKGGCSEIYEAYWIDGFYEEWDSKEKQLKRYGGHNVVLKKLENVESANKSWFEEGKSHLSISNKYGQIVKCYGITKDPSDGNYMLVMFELDNNLRGYLHQNHNKLTWKRRIQIIDDIVYGVSRIHKENAIHRDLHSGNILYNGDTYISDLGFCGPADKPLNSIYGNLPYIAPEVIVKMKYSFASDVYSIGMLMWEISSGQPPFVYKHNYDLALKIINGMRPRIIPGTPLKYKELMEQCWDADPTKRPDIYTLYDETSSLYRSYLINESEEQQTNNITSIDNFQLNTNFSISSTNSINSFFRNSSSRVYYFKDLPEPRNATKEEQEAYHSIQFDFDLQDGMITEVKDESIKRSYINVEGQDDLTINPKKIKFDNSDKDDDDISNPNFHPEEQAELKVSDCKMDLNYLLN